MEKKASIEIKITGKHGKLGLTPELFDIKDIRSLLEDVEKMLFPEVLKERPIISYKIEEGSVRHLFTTSKQTVVGFDAILHDIKKNLSIDFLDHKSALAFEHLQQAAEEKNHTFEITTTVSESKTPFVVSPETTWKRTEDIWVEAEFYFYGELTNAGGKARSNIHIDTKEMGSVTIQTDKDFLKEKEKNLLYRSYGVRATGRQHLQSGEIDTQSLRLVELINVQKKYDENYLEQLIDQATAHWEDIDADEWLNDLRGNYELQRIAGHQFFDPAAEQKREATSECKRLFPIFLDKECTMKLSTISIAEYCVRGKRSDIPFKHLKVIPFNIDHAEQTGIYADILFKDQGVKEDKLLPRPIIPNDSKLFAQAHLDPDIKYYVTADSRSFKTISTLKGTKTVNFEFIDIHTPHHEIFGELPL